MPRAADKPYWLIKSSNTDVEYWQVQWACIGDLDLYESIMKVQVNNNTLHKLHVYKELT